MSLTFTSLGDLFGSRADRIAIALCGDDLSRTLAVIDAGHHIHYWAWDASGTGFGAVIDKASPVGGANPAMAHTADDRVLAAFHGRGKSYFRCLDDSLNENPSIDDAEVEPAYNSVALDGIVRPDHLLYPGPGGAMMVRKTGTTTTTTGPTTGSLPKLKTKITAKPGIHTTIGPKIAYAAAAEVTQDHKLVVGVWMMDWHGGLKTKLGQQVLGLNEPVIFADVAVVNSTWDEDVLKKTEFVTVVQQASPTGPLKLFRWKRDSGGIGLVSVLPAGDHVKAVSIAPLEAGVDSAAATAVIDANGNLKVTAWKLAAAGPMTRGAEATAELVSMVRCAWVRDRDIVTAVKLASGHLKLIYWRFPETGAAIRLGYKMVHTIGSALDVAHIPGEGNTLGETVVATNVASGDLKLLRFGVVQS